MFLNNSKIAGLIKQEYKGLGIKLGIRENGWMYIGGQSWAVECSPTVVPKEVIGEIYKVVGCLPEHGSCFRASKEEGVQEAIENIYSVEGTVLEERKLLPTNLVIASVYGDLRVMEDSLLHTKHLIQEKYLSAIDSRAIVSSAHEGLPEGPFAFSTNSVLWMNDYMKYEVMLKDEEDKGALRVLKMLQELPLIERENQYTDQMEMEV